jgi:hypothetical protein
MALRTANWIIVCDALPRMTVNDQKTILAEIEALLEPGAQTGLEALEHTLTAGYAAALALEAERWRLERRISEAAGLLGEGEGEGEGTGQAQEIGKLARRLADAEDQIVHLRTMLATLRERTDAARAAAA